MSEKTKTPSPPATAERPCPECGELVRPGLVRCWNCGGFMNRDLEKKYLEMQAAPKKVYFSRLPDDADIHEASASTGDDAPEDDFVLTPKGLVPSQKPSNSANPGSQPKASTTDLAGLDDAPEADTFALAKPSVPAAPVAPPAAPAAKPAAAPAAPAVSHSVATGGDALLDIAMNEEAEGRKKKGKRASGPIRTATGFIIFCPYGCRVEVKDQHRGMTGKCPKCRAPFVVPVDPPDYGFAKEREKAVAETAAATSAPGGFVAWMQDIHVHTVNPLKLKLKADSLLKDFAPYDFGFAAGKMLMASLAGKKAGGMFGGKKDVKGGSPRDAMLAHLSEGKPPEELPVGDKRVFTADEVRQIRVVQPEASRAASAFHGIPVFGKNMIAVQLPVGQTGDPQYASFTLSQFRQFNKHLEELYGIEGLAANLGIPMKDDFITLKCHYTETPIKALKDVEWYQADTARPVELAGYKCEGCGLVVSEAGRKKEKLGGANGKGIAKATCPKCKKKFGNKPLYTYPETAAAPSMGE